MNPFRRFFLWYALLTKRLVRRPAFLILLLCVPLLAGAMAANTLVISLELPGMDRNRTSENAPATATPVPTLPFTSMITACTSMGSRIRVIRKFRVE